MWNPIEWVLFVFEVVDFLDEGMASWVKCFERERERE